MFLAIRANPLLLFKPHIIKRSNRCPQPQHRSPPPPRRKVGEAAGRSRSHISIIYSYCKQYFCTLPHWGGAGQAQRQPVQLHYLRHARQPLARADFHRPGQWGRGGPHHQCQRHRHLHGLQRDQWPAILPVAVLLKWETVHDCCAFFQSQQVFCTRAFGAFGQILIVSNNLFDF